jgi:hypothetical protein
MFFNRFPNSKRSPDGMSKYTILIPKKHKKDLKEKKNE